MKVVTNCLLMFSFHLLHAAKLSNTVTSDTPTKIKLFKSTTTSSTPKVIVPKSNNYNSIKQNSVTTEINETFGMNYTYNASTKKQKTSNNDENSTKAYKKSFNKKKNKDSKVIAKKNVPTLDLQNIEDEEESFICPTEAEAQFNLFAPPCVTNNDCINWQNNSVCCKLFGNKNCIKGVIKPLEEQIHQPLLGLVPRKCPERPLAELWWNLKECENDDECWPRVCCPDGQKRFCRNPAVEYNTLPSQLRKPLSYLTEYLECTPPPPRIFDLYPKKCENTLDCFPNVCCQEAGNKHCRPPKKSVLTFMTNFLNIGLVKRLTAHIVIK